MRTLLFTECLQNDFVGPLALGAPLPNALHIGRAESRRLLGDPDGAWPDEGPLARFLDGWVRAAGPLHASFHIRDWHDPADPPTRTHLDHFGDHCLRGTEGAAFVAPLARALEAGGRAAAHVVDSAVLSDFVGTDLEERLAAWRDGGPVRIGIVGVWTDFKVRYLAYDLVTRLGAAEVAVCSALTASRSRIEHRAALDHMATSLGVRVVDSIPEFLGWLGLADAAMAAPPRASSRPAVTAPAGVVLSDEEQRLVEHLFRDCRSVVLEPLSGGFSGSRVFRSRSVDRRGMTEVPFVVKVDTHARIAKERVAVESVENLLGAASPRMTEYVDLQTLGGLKYQFATMHGGDVRTLQRAYRDTSGPDEVRVLFQNVIARVLTRLYQTPALDGLQLFRYYGYQAAYGATTVALAETLGAAEGDRLRIAGLAEALPHPRRFYDRLPAFLDEDPAEVACCWVHGDLNLANVLLDGAGNTWMIDYYWTRVGHALQDVAKLENDLKFILVPLGDDGALARAVAWERALFAQTDLFAEPPALPAGADASTAKAHAAIGVLRGLGATILRDAGVAAPASMREYRIAQLRYAAHTMTFAECTPAQKRFALASTCLLADALSAAGGS